MTTAFILDVIATITILLVFFGGLMILDFLFGYGRYLRTRPRNHPDNDGESPE